MEEGRVSLTSPDPSSPLKKRLVTASVGDVSDVTRQIYNTVAPYQSKVMKRELLK